MLSCERDKVKTAKEPQTTTEETTHQHHWNTMSFPEFGNTAAYNDVKKYHHSPSTSDYQDRSPCPGLRVAIREPIYVRDADVLVDDREVKATTYTMGVSQMRGGLERATGNQPTEGEFYNLVVVKTETVTSSYLLKYKKENGKLLEIIYITPEGGMASNQPCGGSMTTETKCCQGAYPSEHDDACCCPTGDCADGVSGEAGGSVTFNYPPCPEIKFDPCGLFTIGGYTSSTPGDPVPGEGNGNGGASNGHPDLPATFLPQGEMSEVYPDGTATLPEYSSQVMTPPLEGGAVYTFAGSELIDILEIGPGSDAYEWLNDFTNNDEHEQIKGFIDEHTENGDYTQESKDFAIEIAELKANHPEFNVDIEQSFNSPYNIDLDAVTPDDSNPEPEKEKFIAIYETLTDTPLFKNLFEDTFGENPDLNVSFKIVNSLPSVTNPNVQANGQTALENGTLNSAGQLNVDIVIKINKQSLVGANSKSKIIMARTILHETIHAFLEVKKLQSDAGATLASLNNKDLSELINEVYNNFGNNNSDQHDFMFDNLVPALADNLALLKDELIPQNQQDYAEGINFGGYHNGINVPDTPFNWDDFFTNMSMEGLHSTQAFQDEIASDPVKNYIWGRYIQTAAIFD